MFTLKRLLGVLSTLVIGITLTFIIIHLAPGDPSIRFVNPNQATVVQENIRARFGLNESLPVQYLKWIGAVVFRFDFGRSFYSGRPANAIIFSALGATLLLTLSTLLLALLIGILTGVYAALHKDRLSDRICTATMMLLFSIPSFWLGIMLIYIFANRLQWLPSSQLISLFHKELGFMGRIADYLRHLLLPTITLALPLAATFFRYVRSAMIEALQSEYITAARARGLKESKILYRYALRNALLPIISLLGVIIPALLSGVVIVEVIFSYPGVGRVIVSAVFSRDYPVILAATTLTFIFVVIGNLLADIFYGIADPRIGYFAQRNKNWAP